MVTKEDREEAIARQKRKTRVLRSFELYLPEMTDSDIYEVEAVLWPIVGRIAMGQE